MKKINSLIAVIFVTTALLTVIIGCYSSDLTKKVETNIVGEIGVKEQTKELTFNKPETHINQAEYIWSFVMCDPDTHPIFIFDFGWRKNTAPSFVGEPLKTCEAAIWITDSKFEYREKDTVFVVHRKEKLPLTVIATDSSYIFKGQIVSNVNINSIVACAIAGYNIKEATKNDLTGYIRIGETVTDSIGDTPDPVFDITFFRLDTASSKK